MLVKLNCIASISFSDRFDFCKKQKNKPTFDSFCLIPNYDQWKKKHHCTVAFQNIHRAGKARI